MDRRLFLQLAAVPAFAGTGQTPQYRVVSHYPATASPGIPGPYRGQVTRVHANAVVDEKTGHIDSNVVDRMLSEGMQSLTGAKSDKEAWGGFFSAADVVGIKVNCSGAPAIRSSPEVIAGIVRRLGETGVQPDNIYIYERFGDQLKSVKYGSYVPAGVHITAIESSGGSILGYDPKTYVEVSFFGEDDTRSNLARLVTDRLTKIINVPNTKEHQAAGVTGCLKNIAYGSFSNVARSHRNEKTNTLSFIGTLASVEPLRSKTVLNIMDGIRGVWHGGPFSELERYRFYPKLLLFGTDPVAMDRMPIDIIEEKRIAEGAPSLWDRSMANIDPRAHLDYKKNTFIREPGHVEYAAKLGLGEYDKSRIRVKALEV